MKPDLDAKVISLVNDEVNAITKIGPHPGVVQVLENSRMRYYKANESPTEHYVIALEYVSGGVLFDYVAEAGAFSEPFARYYFKQFMDALDFVHQRGIAHRDLKPENVMLDLDHNLKIADFGLSGPAMGRDGSGFLKTKLGTPAYWAPEIHLR